MYELHQKYELAVYKFKLMCHVMIRLKCANPSTSGASLHRESPIMPHISLEVGEWADCGSIGKCSTNHTSLSF